MTIINALYQSISFGWNNCYSTVCLNAVNQCIRIVALVRQHSLRLYIFQQCRRLRNISDFTTRQQTTHRIAQCIDCSVNFTGPSSARTTYGLRPFFFFAPAACWCARTAVLSIMSISKSASLLTTSLMRFHTPYSPQRLNRVYVVCQLPNSFGRSRHGEPVRMIHNTASKNSRLSCAVAPGSLAFPGNSSPIFSHWSSRNNFLSFCNFGTRLFKYRM